MNHARLLDGHVGDLSVQERHLDAQRCDRVMDAIESITVPPTEAVLAVIGSCNGCSPGDWMAEQARQQHLYEQRIDAMRARNRKAPAPCANEIRSLQEAVKPAKKLV